MAAPDNEEWTALDKRLRTILPELYQDCYNNVQPVSMGSASLKFDESGSVLWDEMWDDFCDLAMAGGPPHKGTLLTPGTEFQINAEPDRYRDVVKEICRGIALVTDLRAELSAFPGWLQVECNDDVTAAWLVRAIVMENVSSHWDGTRLFLPAGPAYRIEKEIKNVITVVAKTCHYWEGHMWASQQRQIADLFAKMAVETPLLQPPFPATERQDPMVEQIMERQTGMKVTAQSNGWLGLECESVEAAIWKMRGLVASNVLSRREGNTLFVPLNPETDPDAQQLMHTFSQVHALWLYNSAR